MITQKDKASPRLIRKRGTTNNVMKSWPLSDGEFIDAEAKSDFQTKSEIFGSFSTSDPASGNHYGRCCETTPRDAGRETSKGVHDFIKQVSNVIENKNPFSGTLTYSYGRPEKNIDPAVIDSVKFSKADSLLKMESQNCEVSRKENPKKNIEIEKSKRKLSESKLSSQKNSEKSSPSKKNKSGSSSKKRDHSSKRSQKESSPNIKKLSEPKSAKSPNNFYNSQKNERQYEKIYFGPELTERPTSKSSQTRRKKRSEIPLRKNRTDASRKPKPLSFLVRNPLKKVESAFSVDLNSNNKTFSPIEELSLCSELQITIHPVGSSENLSDSEKTTDFESVQRSTFIFENIKLDRCTKSSNISEDDYPLGDELVAQRPYADTKTNENDLDKVKTSSFTVLRTNTTVLNRLESLHKRNISTKESPIFTKKSSGNSSRPKVVTSKPSFSSLKGKGSKKHLSTRLSSKGNKPGLKIKGRKFKNVGDENLRLPKIGSPEENKSNFDICKPMITRNWCVKDEKPKNQARIKESAVVSSTKSGKRGGKSSPRSVGTSKGKEELKPPSRGRHTGVRGDHEDSKKITRLKSFKNQTFVKKSFIENIMTKEKVLKSEKEIPNTPPPSPVTAQNASAVSRQSEESEARNNPTNRKNVIGKTEREDINKGDNSDLIVRGTSLNISKDEPTEKPEVLESENVKNQIKIDLTCQKSEAECNLPENTKNRQSLDWLFMNSQKYEREGPHNIIDAKNLGNEEIKHEVDKKKNYATADSFSSNLTDEQGISETPVLDLQKSHSEVKKTEGKSTDETVKGMKKKKIRSDAGDRRLPPSSFFKSQVSIQNKIKTDPKLRSSFTKSSNREEKRDMFEDSIAVKLRRRNSEPHSLKEYIWKPPEFAISKSHKPSVSSVASSLRHLNTDEIDDFIFWEPVPQKVTSCWETSLYNFKRAWTVLSCSVFRDNRQSNTPGLILENLRNGGSLNSSRPSRASQNEVSNYHKENLFDVEPSIAQKNIDIKNWLAALNFPTLPSTSSDVISEGSFTQSITEALNLKTTQASTKRRKVLPNLKFSDDSTKKTQEEKEKFKTSTDWSGKEADDLMELIQRKSGGFVAKKEFTEYKYSTNFNAYSKPADDKPTPDETPHVNTDPQDLKSSEPSTFATAQFGPEAIGLDVPNHAVGNGGDKYDLPSAEKEERKFQFKRFLKRNLNLFFTRANIWKYLLILILVIVILHLCIISSSLFPSQLL